MGFFYFGKKKKIMARLTIAWNCSVPVVLCMFVVHVFVHVFCILFTKGKRPVGTLRGLSKVSIFCVIPFFFFFFNVQCI